MEPPSRYAEEKGEGDPEDNNTATANNILKRRGVDAEEEIPVVAASPNAFPPKRQKFREEAKDGWEQDYPHYDDENWKRANSNRGNVIASEEEKVADAWDLDLAAHRPVRVATRQRLRPQVVQLARGDQLPDENEDDIRMGSEPAAVMRQPPRPRRRMMADPPAAAVPPANHPQQHQRFILDLPTWMKPKTLQWKTVLFALAITACVSMAIFAAMISTSSNDQSHVDSSQHLTSSQNSINLPEDDGGDEYDTTISTVLPQIIDTFYTDVDEPYNRNTHLPVLFQLRKSIDSTMVMEHFGACIGWLQATNVGRNYVSEQLETLNTQYGTYVNVDLSKSDGIQHAHDLYLLYQPPSELQVDAIATPLLYEVASKILDTSMNRGKIFMMVPDPQQYVYSIYAFLKSGEWLNKVESVTNPNPYENMSFLEYAREDRPEFNLLAKSLTGKFNDALTFADLEVAKQFLRQKVLVGLVDDRETSLERFQSHFGASLKEPATNECRAAPSNWPSATAASMDSESSSDLSQAIQTCCQLDLAIYQYARQLFIDQESLFPTQF